MYITKEELKTHLYDEILTAISGEDDTLVTAAIDGAVAEAKGYLHKWDRDAEFAKTGETRNALLVIFVKDIAVWHFINLANPGCDLKTRQDRYKSAVQWLKDVQAGLIVPDLPELDPVEGEAGSFAWGSNPKRENHI
jgi:phage gp36-like protein